MTEPSLELLDLKGMFLNTILHKAIPLIKPDELFISNLEIDTPSLTFHRPKQTGRLDYNANRTHKDCVRSSLHKSIGLTHLLK